LQQARPHSAFCMLNQCVSALTSRKGVVADYVRIGASKHRQIRLFRMSYG
jgi:hypothetical protein